jgi:hypothetical protein
VSGQETNTFSIGFRAPRVTLTTLVTGFCFSYLPTKRISTRAQYVSLDNKMKCLSIAVFFLATPTINYDWNCICVGTTNSKPPGPIILINQSEILNSSQVQFITLFFGGAKLCCNFYQPRQAARIW